MLVKLHSSKLNNLKIHHLSMTYNLHTTLSNKIPQKFLWENTDRHKYASFRFRFKISKRCAYNTA